MHKKIHCFLIAVNDSKMPIKQRVVVKLEISLDGFNAIFSLDDLMFFAKT